MSLDNKGNEKNGLTTPESGRAMKVEKKQRSEKTDFEAENNNETKEKMDQPIVDRERKHASVHDKADEQPSDTELNNESEIRELKSEGDSTALIKTHIRNATASKETDSSPIRETGNFIGESLSPEDLKKPTVDYQTIYEDRIRAYLDKVDYFKSEEGETDFKVIHQAQSDFSRWKNYLIELHNSFENLHFDLTEVVENDIYSIRKEDYVMCLPINMKNRKENFNALNKFSKVISNRLTKPDLMNNLHDSILSLQGVNVRKGGELDYFLINEDLPEDLLLFQKKLLNTLLLIFKNFLKTGRVTANLVAYALEAEVYVYEQLDYFKPDTLIEAIISKKDTLIEQVLGQADNFLNSNYQAARKAEEIADELRKRYFLLLNKTLIKVYNELRDAKKYYEHFMETISHDSESIERIKNWGGIYTQLKNIILEYLKDRLDIAKIPCKRGDEYNDQMHKPIAQSEPDEYLENNQVKRVVNEGFNWRPKEMLANGSGYMIVKPVDIIAVNNRFKK